MKAHRSLVALLAAMILLVACQIPPTPRVAVTISTSPTSEATQAASAPTATVAPTLTPLPTPTVRRTRTPRPTDQPVVEGEVTLPGRQTLGAIGQSLPDGAVNRIGDGIIESAGLSPEGNYLLVNSTTSMSLHLTEDFIELWSRPATRGGGVFSPEGRWIVVNDDRNLYLLDVQTGETVLTLPTDAEPYEIRDYAWSPDHRRIAILYKKLTPSTASYPFHLDVYDVSSGNILLQNEIEDTNLHPTLSNDLYWLRQGILHFAIDYKTYFAINSETGEELYRLQTDKGIEAWNLDTGTLLYLTEEGECVAIDIATGEERYRFLPRGDHQDEHAFSWPHLRFISGNRIVATYGWFAAMGGANPAYALNIWDGQTGAHLHTVTSELPFSQVSTHDEWLIPSYYTYALAGSGEQDVTFPIFDASTGMLTRTINTVEWVEENDAPIETWGILERSMHTARWSPDGGWIADLSKRGMLTVWDAASGDTVFQVEDAGESLLWTENSCCVLTYDKTQLTLWDIEAQEARYTVNRQGHVLIMAFSPDGNRLAYVTNQTMYHEPLIHIYDLQQQRLISSGSLTVDDYDSWFGMYGYLSLSLQFSPDSNLVAVVGSNDDLDLSIWNIDTNEEIIPDLLEHRMGEYSFSTGWLPDGSLAIGAGQRTLLWNLQSGIYEERHVPIDTLLPETHITTSISDGSNTRSYTFAHPPSEVEYTVNLVDSNERLEIYDIFWPRDKPWLAVYFSYPTTQPCCTFYTPYEGAVVIWDAEKSSLLRVLDAHSEEIMDIELSPDGNTLATSSIDGTIILWDVRDLPQ